MGYVLICMARVLSGRDAIFCFTGRSMEIGTDVVRQGTISMKVRGVFMLEDVVRIYLIARLLPKYISRFSQESFRMLFEQLTCKTWTEASFWISPTTVARFAGFASASPLFLSVHSAVSG
jgi:hypothetical protein